VSTIPEILRTDGRFFLAANQQQNRVAARRRCDEPEALLPAAPARFDCFGRARSTLRASRRFGETNLSDGGDERFGGTNLSDGAGGPKIGAIAVI